MIELELRHQGMPIARYRFEEDSVYLGRDPNNDLSFDDARSSRHHARISRREFGYELEDLESLNGTRLNGMPIKQARLKHEDEVQIGDYTIIVLSTGVMENSDHRPEPVLDQTRVAEYPGAVSELSPAPWTVLVEQDLVTIQSIELTSEGMNLGRDPDSEVVLLHEDVSRHHARIICKHGRYYIEDLDSLNKTFVDKEPVYTYPLEPDSTIRIGPFTLRFVVRDDRAGITDEPRACRRCRREVIATWSTCPFCQGQPTYRRMMRIQLEPLKAPHPGLLGIDEATALQLREETVASERHLWVSFTDSENLRHPLGQVPDLAVGCDRCFFVVAQGSELHLCPQCSSSRLGQLDVRTRLLTWMDRHGVEVRVLEMGALTQTGPRIRVELTAVN